MLFSFARDSGDDQGQPTGLRPPQEWLNDYDTWAAQARPAGATGLGKRSKTTHRLAGGRKHLRQTASSGSIPTGT